MQSCSVLGKHHTICIHMQQQLALTSQHLLNCSCIFSHDLLEVSSKKHQKITIPPTIPPISTGIAPHPTGHHGLLPAWPAFWLHWDRVPGAWKRLSNMGAIRGELQLSTECPAHIMLVEATLRSFFGLLGFCFRVLSSYRCCVQWDGLFAFPLVFARILLPSSCREHKKIIIPDMKILQKHQKESATGAV